MEAVMDGVLDARARQELADLRRRAYGTDADILTDPAALARLEALERRAHVAAPTDRKSTRLNSSHRALSRMPSSA